MIDRKIIIRNTVTVIAELKILGSELIQSLGTIV